MLLKTLRATNAVGDHLTMGLESSQDGYIIKDITGLGPVKATLVSTSFANQDGAQFYAGRRDIRNITIKLGLDPNYTQETPYTLRDKLYSFFMSKSEVSLLFIINNLLSTGPSLPAQREIVGRVEACEPDIFSSDPTVDVTILCFNPDFYSSFGNSFEFLTTSSGMGFNNFLYNGTVETGVELVLEPNRSVSSPITIYHKNPSSQTKTMVFDASKYPLVNLDQVRISSIPGEKGVYVRNVGSGSVWRPILYAIDTDSKWIELTPGPNDIGVHVSGNGFRYQISWRAKFGGL